jgi:hypothetical protein
LPDPQVTITTVGPDGRTQTISGPAAAKAGQADQAAQAEQRGLAPVALISHEPGLFTTKIVSLGMVGSFFVLLPISIAIAIRMIRRPMRHQNQLSPGVDDRLTRLEQSIDAIAIEMERVSEGQRYVTKLLARDEISARTD